MKMMIWKELRENLKWGVLAFLCLITAELYSLSSQSRDNGNNFQDLTLCSSAFLLVTSFGCSIMGAALGVIQILPELRRDQWASLLHRPVSRSVIFFGKVVAGLILYFCASVISFLASVIYVAIPGQFAVPLVPGMLLPGLSDLLLGPVFYFAALLLCLHRGRWFGVRGAIALSVVPIFLLHLTTMGWAFLLPIGFALVVLVAAWGAVQSNGNLLKGPWAGRVALIVVVFMGIQTVVLTLLLTIGWLPVNKTGGTQVYTSFAITRDGTVFIESQNGDGILHYTDLNGKAVTDERFVGNSSYQNFYQLLPFSWRLRVYFDQNIRSSRTYLSSFSDYGSKESWYLLPKQKYFIGYDKLSRRVVGICDAEGFKPATATPHPFAEDVRGTVLAFQQPHLFWSGDELASYDFAERSRTTFNTEHQPIYGGINLSTTYAQDKPTLVAAALEKEIFIFDSKGTLLSRLPYPHDPEVWSNLSLAFNEKADGIYLESSASTSRWSALSDPTENHWPTYLDEIDLHGAVLHTYSRQDTSHHEYPPTWTSRLEVALSPFLPAAISEIRSLFSTAKINRSSASFAPTPYLPLLSAMSGRSDFLVLFILALILGGLTRAVARRHGLSPRQTWLWTLFVFCFGLPGLITFFLASDWPTRVKCSKCGWKRSTETDHCGHCQAGWPLNQPSSVDIIDTIPATADVSA